MTAKQHPGITAPDGSMYITQTNGLGALTYGGTKQTGSVAKDGSQHVTITDGKGKLL